MLPCLDAWEKFLHDRFLPPLIQAALVHYPFEAIHSFMDGNGLIFTCPICVSGTYARTHISRGPISVKIETPGWPFRRPPDSFAARAR